MDTSNGTCNGKSWRCKRRKYVYFNVVLEKDCLQKTLGHSIANKNTFIYNSELLQECVICKVNSFLSCCEIFLEWNTEKYRHALSEVLNQ